MPYSEPSPGQLKVMISSTALDLPHHRKEVMEAILRAGCFPLAMEHGTATSDSDAIRSSVDMVDKADIYIGIFAQRYGFVPNNQNENPEGWSVTEHEYRRAVLRDIPRLIYLATEEHKFSMQDFDFDPSKRARLLELRAELGMKEICGLFPSPEKLHSLVVQSLFEEKQKHPFTATDSRPVTPVPHPPEFYAVPPYTLTSTFIGRRAELGELDTWAVSPNPVMVVEAIGGMGKSALTWEWTQRNAEENSGLAGRVWWSFYERGTSMKTFLRYVLAYVTRQTPESLRDLDTYDCGQQLLIELKRRPYLLVLDGFERVLMAYHRIDKAQVSDDHVRIEARDCINPSDGDILKRLAHCSPSKVLVSTRLMPKVLEDPHTHQPIPGVHQIKLEGLTSNDTLAMIRRAEINGDAEAVLRFADQFGRHALILRIVCGMVTDYRLQPRNFDAWLADPRAGGGLKLTELHLSQRYTHILEYAFRGLGEKPRQLLSRIAVLSDSADYATIAVLNPFLPLQSEEIQEPQGSAFFSANDHGTLADFHAALGDLEDRGLLQWNRAANTYDLHPVVRAYAFEKLEERERTQAYNAIHDHFSNLPPENLDKATELIHVKNSVEIMRALIGAGRFKEAFNFYREQLSRPFMFLICSFHVVVELMEPLLHCGTGSAHALEDTADRSYATNDLAIALERIGRPSEAMELYRLRIALDLEGERWASLVAAIQNWASCTWHLNRPSSFLRGTQLASELSFAGGYENFFTACLLSQMADATIRGQFEDAERLLDSFRQRYKPVHGIYRPGDAEYWVAVLRFYQGTLRAADLEQAKQASEGRNLLVSHALWSLRAQWELNQGNPRAALNSIDQALSIVRRTGEPTSSYLGIQALALARLGQTGHAREALAEGDQSSEGQLLTFLWFAAETWLALGDHDKACEAVKLAYPLAWADGLPYSRAYELKQCRKLLLQLGEPEPQLPPFDPAKIEPVPFETEIRAVTKDLKEKHVKGRS
jgi:tetratricopeptide (TPR) repeat protein